MKLLLIRHGQSVGNLEERLQGQAEYPLTQKGRDQAQALTRRLQREGWSLPAIYASDQSRAAATAEILSAGLGAPVSLDARLREYDAGELNGIVFHEMEARYPELWHAWKTSPEWVPFPGSEGTDAFHARLSASLADIQDKHSDDQAVAIVSHGGSLGMILAYMLRLDIHRPTPFFFGNTSLSIVQLTLRGPRLTLMNDTSHLDGELI